MAKHYRKGLDGRMRDQADCGGVRPAWAETWTSGVFDRRRSGRTGEPNRCGIIRKDVSRMPVREGARRSGEAAMWLDVDPSRPQRASEVSLGYPD